MTREPQRCISILAVAVFVCTTHGMCRAADAPEIRAGSELDFRPYCFTDKDGRPTGFAVELLRAVADNVGLRLQITPGPWNERWADLVAGKLDVLPIVARTPGREPLVDFSLPHTETFDAFFVHADRSPFPDLAAADGKEIVVLREDAAHHQLGERKFAGQIIPVESISEGLRLIAAGKHDAFLCSKMIGLLEMQAAGVRGVTAGPLIPDYKRVFCFGVRKGHAELVEKLNQGLLIVKTSGEYDRIYQRWLTVEEPWHRWLPFFKVVVGGLVVLAGLAVVLQWLVRRRTRELKRATAALETEVGNRRQAEAALQQLNATLERRVADRTADSHAANASLRDARLAALNLLDDAVAARKKADWLARFPGENPSPVLRVTTDGRVLYANPAAAGTSGWTSGDAQRLASPLLPLVERAVANRAPVEQDVELGGRTYAVAVALFPEEGYANLYGSDITERKRAEQREQEVLARAAASQTAVDVLDAMGEGVLLLDMNGSITSVNPALEKMAGIPAGELTGRPLRDLLPELLAPEDRTLAEEALGAATEGRVPDLQPITLLSRTGRRIPLIPSVTFVRGPDKRPTEIVATLRDISELVESQEKYRELVENANSIIMRITPEHNIAFFNEYAQTFFGYTDDEVIGKNVVGTIVPPVDSEGRDLRKMVREVTAQPEAHAGNENENMCKDGRRVWVHWANRAVRDDKGHLKEILCVGTDITGRKRMEKEAEVYRKRLRDLAHRLAVTEEQERRRVSTHIHDTVIQTLSLSSIRLGGLRKAAETAGLAEHCEKVDQVRALLDTGIAECRGLMGDLTPPLLYELGLGPALTDFARKQQQAHGITIEFDEDDRPKPLDEARRGLLFQAARELVMNAVKHARTREIFLSLRRLDDEVRLEVRDTGCGFDPASLDGRVTDFEKGGFGIFNIRERLQGLGGRLEIASAPGKGTTVTVRIPMGSGSRGQEAGSSSREG